MTDPPHDPPSRFQSNDFLLPGNRARLSSLRSLRMRTDVSWAPRKRHHGGVRSQRAVCRAESDGPVVGGDFGSYRHRQVQAGDRDRKTAPGRNNQRRLHAGRKTVNWKKCAGSP